MGWLTFVGSFKLQVSFAKEPCKRDCFFPKETYNSKEPTTRSHPIPICTKRAVLKKPVTLCLHKFQLAHRNMRQLHQDTPTYTHRIDLWHTDPYIRKEPYNKHLILSPQDVQLPHRNVRQLRLGTPHTAELNSNQMQKSLANCIKTRRYVLSLFQKRPIYISKETYL